MRGGGILLKYALISVKIDQKFRIQVHLILLLDDLRQWTKMDDVLPLVDMNIDTFEAQIDLSEKILKNYYSKYPETPVVCHNDLHPGNIMRNKAWIPYRN